MPESVDLTSSELAALDMIITKLQEEGVSPSANVIAWTPVVRVVVQATLHTARVACASVASDQAKVDQIQKLADELQSSTSLEKLLELRSRAIRGHTMATQQIRANSK